MGRKAGVGGQKGTLGEGRGFFKGGVQRRNLEIDDNVENGKTWDGPVFWETCNIKNGGNSTKRSVAGTRIAKRR